MKGNNTPALLAVLELVVGYCGFLGVGWIVAGRIGFGVLLLLAYSTFLALGAFLISLSLGCLAFIVVPLHIVIPIISTIKVYEFANQ